MAPRRSRLVWPRPGSSDAARKHAGNPGGTMQRKKKQEAEAARAPQGLAPPAPDPRHPEAVLDTVPRAEECETYALRRGDLLLSEASGSASEVGKPAVWNDEVPGCCFQNTLIRVRAPEPLVPFLHLHFYKDALTGEFARAARGVGINHLGAKTLSGWEVHLPPPDEQRRIVETVDSHLTRLDHVTTTLQRVRRNLNSASRNQTWSPSGSGSQARRRLSASRLLGFHKALRTAPVLRVSVELVRELFPQGFAQDRIALARADQVQDIHYCLEYLMALKQEI